MSTLRDSAGGAGAPATTALAREYGPDKSCQRTACADGPAHLGGVHIDPRSPLYDGPNITVNALGGGPRRAARALLAAGASVPDVVDLVNEIHRLRDQVAAVQVNGDRQVRAAMDRALDCEDHGKTIKQLEEQVAYFDQRAERNDNGRLALVSGLHQLEDYVGALRTKAKAGEKLPSIEAVAGGLAKFLDKIGASHMRAWRADERPAKAKRAAPSKVTEPVAAVPPELDGQGDLFGGDLQAVSANA